jgi:hypothetical protein
VIHNIYFSLIVLQIYKKLPKFGKRKKVGVARLQPTLISLENNVTVTYGVISISHLERELEVMTDDKKQIVADTFLELSLIDGNCDGDEVMFQGVLLAAIGWEETNN